jgi:hypothetical protein
MKTIDLSDEEIEILAAVLRSYLSDLRMEIADTDSLEFRQILKRRKAVLLKAIGALENNDRPQPA